MEFRNPAYNQHGSIDCEINHPKFGWIPFTAAVDDPEPGTAGIYASIMESEDPIAPYVPPAAPEPTLGDYQAAISSLLDQTAQGRQYDSAIAIASYVGSTVPQWAAEAAAFIAWRDAVWSYAYAELDKVTEGLRSQPSVSDFLAELPTVAWPS